MVVAFLVCCLICDLLMLLIVGLLLVMVCFGDLVGGFVSSGFWFVVGWR